MWCSLRSVPRRPPRVLWLLVWLLAGCAQVQLVPEPVRLPEGPLTLDDALVLAQQNNPDVRSGRQRVLAAAQLVDEASSMFWPEVSVGGQATRTDRPSQVFGQLLDQGQFSPTVDFNSPGTVTNFRVGAGLGLTLYDGGRRKARLSQAEAALGSSMAAEEELRSMIAFEVARAFYGVRSARLAADTAAQAVPVITELLRVVAAEQQFGDALPVQARQLQVRLAEARASFRSARRAIRRATSALRILLGWDVSQSIELAAEDQDPGATSAEAPRAALSSAAAGAAEAGTGLSLEPLAVLLERARFGRPELVRAQHQIEGALAALREAEAGYWPSLTVFGELGSDNSGPRLSHSNWLFGAGLVQNITETLRTPRRVAAQTARLVIAHEQARKVLLAVEADVEAAWLDLGDAEADLALARQESQRRQQQLARVAAERDLGAARNAEWLAARLSARQARAAERGAGYRVEMARLGLQHAIGAFPASSPDTESEESP